MGGAGAATGVRVREVETRFERWAYRTPLKFRGVPVTHATVLTARVRVETEGGACIMYLGGQKLEVIEALKEAKKKYENGFFRKRK